MRVCVSMFDVVKPCVSMRAPLRRSMPAGCGVRSCVSMCAPRAVRCHAKDLMKFQLGISNADPRLCIRQRSPAISHTINPVFTTYSRSPHCFITINYSFVTFNYSFVKLAHTYTKARKPEPPDGHCATERPAFCCS